MTESGRLAPEPPNDGSDERDYAALLNSAPLDSADLAQQPDAELNAVLRESRIGRDRAKLGLTREHSSKTGRDHAPAPGLDAELDVQEGDCDR